MNKAKLFLDEMQFVTRAYEVNKANNTRKSLTHIKPLIEKDNGLMGCLRDTGKLI